MATVTDYDAPRRRDIEDTPADPIREVASGLTLHGDAMVDEDPSDLAELFELPGADLSGEELVVKIIPKRADEFTCTSCFLVYHRSRMASVTSQMCADCA
ncbi:hypothetical protein BVC93_06465 [Mycobacterium sp. MS1601]|uniref:DUF4193 domain-containing protein n=1 Tax=Mycobacterium sp. MS1601 TaxID=1936029 RepID=UPI00097972D5|nr:DUF4193 domain-containing protein [Mycobacterium sp. MS1601]AQA02128.1 hypothetical protein BVC93_06465 [Mycobacterium sp. MS1601]